MRFTWNARKRALNMKKHGFDFEDATNAFEDLDWTSEDKRFDYPERRFRTMGLINGKVVVLIHTGDEENTHVISFRKATRCEAAEYFQSLRQ